MYENFFSLDTLPLHLAAFFKLSITEGLMVSNIKRPSSPGYRDLRTTTEEKKKEMLTNTFCVS